MTSAARLFPLLFLTSLGGASCATPSSVLEGTLLADLLPGAEVRVERRLLDFGDESVHPHLASGWSWDEVFETEGGGRTTFVWGLAPASELSFDLFETRDLELLLRSRAYGHPGAPTQSIQLELNGRSVTTIDVPAAMSELEIRLPASALVVGRNLLRFRYAWGRAPSEHSDSPDERPLAVLFDRLRFDGVPEPTLPRRDGKDLLLPVRSETAFYFETGPSLKLRWSGAAVRGEAEEDPPLVEVTWTTDTVPERRLTKVPVAGDFQLALPEAEEGVVRLGLRIVGAGSGVRLEAPQIVALDETPQPAPPSQEQGKRGGVAGDERPNLLLYVVDTLRADALGCYGQELPVTPRIDAFAEQAVLFERAFAQSSWTRPSTASILSGLLPEAHRANRESGLAAEIETLGERLLGGGYRTAAFVGNPNLTGGDGFEQGFEHFEGFDGVAGSPLAAVGDWLEVLERGAPYFLYIHTYEPHFPLLPPEDLRARFAPEVDDRLLEALYSSQGVTEALRSLVSAETLRRLYLADVAAADRNFGAMLDLLGERDLAATTVVVLVSDHGEELFERGNYGHRGLFGEIVDIPLLVRPAGGTSARRVTAPVQHVDLLPTFLDLVDLPAEGLAGRSQAEWIVPGDSVLSKAPVVVSQVLATRGDLVSARERSVVWNGWKLIEYYRGEHPASRWLFAPGDVAEDRNVAAQYPVRVGHLRSLARARERLDGPPVSPPPSERDAEHREQLRALGYVE